MSRILDDGLIEVDVVVVGDNGRVSDNLECSDLGPILNQLLPRGAHAGHTPGVVHGGVDTILVDESGVAGVCHRVLPEHPGIADALNYGLAGAWHIYVSEDAVVVDEVLQTGVDVVITNNLSVVVDPLGDGAGRPVWIGDGGEDSVVVQESLDDIAAVVRSVPDHLAQVVDVFGYGVFCVGEVNGGVDAILEE